MSIILHIVAAGVFLRFLQRRFGDRACLRAAWILSTYPGIFYWIGLPYSYAFIVPGSLLSAVILARLDQHLSWQRAFYSGLFLGILFTGYDLFTIYGAAVVLLCLYRRRFVSAALLLIGIALPITLSLVVLSQVLGAPLTNPNSEIFGSILSSYFSMPDLAAWGALLTTVPRSAWNAFFFSNFLVLPIAFVAILGCNPKKFFGQLNAWEWAVLLGGVLFFLFNNLAPPYEGKWQMRGDWVARLYQPIFPVFISVLARLAPIAREARVSVMFLGTVVLVNCAIVFGPLVRSPIADYVYHNFYRHAFETFRMSQNVDRYGARPLGFCDPFSQ